jgi:membrane-bound lytic murein transglycosylase B
VRLPVTCLLACLLALAAGHGAAQGYGERAEVRRFTAQLVEKHGFVESELAQLFARVQRVDPVIEAMERPAEFTRTWPEYRATFLDEKRIAEGVQFWQKHRRTLERAERAYGVPPQIVVAIIGVETFYGRNTGRWRVVDALATLAFDYPPRASFFRSELENYLIFARDRGVDVFAMRGSYAGAMGLPQFMPSSARVYGVDFDKDGHVDLRRSTDAIGSVANYLRQHGWRRGEPVSLKANASGEGRALAGGGFLPRHRLAELIALGVELDPAPQDPEAKAALIDLGTELRAGLQNFYVITRYNRSALYAAAVSDLAEALAARAQSAGR